MGQPQPADPVRLVKALSEKCLAARSYALEGELRFKPPNTRSYTFRMRFALAVSEGGKYALHLGDPKRTTQASPPRETIASSANSETRRAQDWNRIEQLQRDEPRANKRGAYSRISDGQTLWIYSAGVNRYTVRKADNRNADFEARSVIASFPDPVERVVEYAGRLGSRSLPDEGDPAEPLVRLILPALARLRAAAQIDSKGFQKTNLTGRTQQWPLIRAAFAPHTFTASQGRGGINLEAQTLAELVMDPATLAAARLTITSGLLSPRIFSAVDFVFSRFELGTSSADAAFAFTPPKGAKLADAIALPGQTGSALLGARAPDFLTEDLNGKPVRLSSFRGRPVLVAFWGTPGSGSTDCRECSMLPFVLQKLHVEFGERLVVMALGHGLEADRRAATEAGLTYLILSDRPRPYNLSDKTSEAAIFAAYPPNWKGPMPYMASMLFRATLAPALFLIDGNGIVTGFLRDYSEENLRAMLKARGL